MDEQTLTPECRNVYWTEKSNTGQEGADAGEEPEVERSKKGTEKKFWWPQDKNRAVR